MIENTDRTEQSVWRLTAADIDGLIGRVATDAELAEAAKIMDYAWDPSVLEDWAAKR